MTKGSLLCYSKGLFVSAINAEKISSITILLLEQYNQGWELRR